MLCQSELEWPFILQDRGKSDFLVLPYVLRSFYECRMTETPQMAKNKNITNVVEKTTKQNKTDLSEIG